MTQPVGMPDSGSPSAGSPLDHEARVVRRLLAMKPWIRFFSVVCFVLAGLIVIGSLALAGGGLLTEELGRAGWFIALFYFGIAFVYLFAGLHLHRAATALTDLAATGRAESIELSLVHQFRFWRFMGVIAIVILVLYVIGTVFLVRYLVTSV